MFKSIVIALLGTLLIMQHPAYATHRNIMVFVSMVAALFYVLAIIESSVKQYKAARHHQKRFKQQVEDIHLRQNRRQA